MGTSQGFASCVTRHPRRHSFHSKKEAATDSLLGLLGNYSQLEAESKLFVTTLTSNIEVRKIRRKSFPLIRKKYKKTPKTTTLKSIKQTSRELLVKTLNISYFFSSRLFVVYQQEGVQDSGVGGSYILSTPTQKHITVILVSTDCA